MLYRKGLFTFDNQTELPLSAARVLNVRYQAFRAGAWRKFSQVPEEGTMPKQSHKSVAVRTCALACVVGLSLNTFAIASPVTRLPGSARTSSEALATELMP